MKPLAVFTIAHNEPLFLPVWLRHYTAQVDAADAFVLDHDSVPSHQTDCYAAGANHVPVSRKAFFDHDWLCETVARFQHFLLQSYRAVLFAESDELVFADPARYPSLTAYARATEDGPAAVRCDGYNVWHDRAAEPPLVWTGRLLAQRKWAHPSAKYSKPLFGRVPLRWRHGFHKLAKDDGMPKTDVDRALVLVHLHRACYTSCLDRKKQMAARRWDKDALRTGEGSHNRIVDEAEFAAWFDDAADLGEARIPIPEPWKLVV